MNKSFARQIDKGFYQQAKADGKHPLVAMTELVKPEPPEWEKIADRLERQYSARLRHPIAGTPLSDRLAEYAYQVSGLQKLMDLNGISGSDTVEKAFFSSTNASGTQGLFPAFLASQIISGQLAASLVPMLCLAEVRIGSHLQEKVQISDTVDSRQTRHISEGVSIPKTSIAKTQGSIALQKYGRMLEATYETVRLLTLDIISLQLQRIGRQIGIDETDELLETALGGDGNAGSINNPIAVQSAGTLTYNDLITLWQQFPIGYEMRHCVTNDTEIKNVLNLAEFKDPLAGFNTQATGLLPGPLGSTWHRWTSTGSATLGTNKIAAFDDRLAIVLYREGDLLEEADQLIDKQIYQRTMTEWVGFMVWDPAAIVSMTV